MRPEPDDKGIEIPERVLIDREKREKLRPKDCTAAFFGNPLPGYSALERPEQKSKISLAGHFTWN